MTETTYYLFWCPDVLNTFCFVRVRYKHHESLKKMSRSFFHVFVFFFFCSLRNEWASLLAIMYWLHLTPPVIRAEKGWSGRAKSRCRLRPIADILGRRRGDLDTKRANLGRQTRWHAWTSVVLVQYHRTIPNKHKKKMCQEPWQTKMCRFREPNRVVFGQESADFESFCYVFHRISCQDVGHFFFFLETWLFIISKYQ